MHPILIETRSYRRPLYRRPEAVLRPLWTNQLCVASLRFFREVLLYQHQLIVTMTKVYIASNSIHVEIIRFHTIETLVTFETRQQRAHCYPRRVATVLSHPPFATSLLARWQLTTHRHQVVSTGGDSLVFIFSLATMLTFTSAIGRLNVRVLWHHHMLLQVISQSYCQVFVKSYNFVFEKIDIEYAPYQKWQKNRSFCTHPLQINTPPTGTCFVKNPPENCVSE